MRKYTFTEKGHTFKRIDKKDRPHRIQERFNRYYLPVQLAPVYTLAQ